MQDHPTDQPSDPPSDHTPAATHPHGTWPDSVHGSDAALDVQGVQDQTGCTLQDYQELGEVFLQECPNIMRRLQQAQQAVLQAEGHQALMAAAQLLRAAAHELCTSFSIVGARAAEAYARQTQNQIKRSASGEGPPQKAEALLQALTVLQQAVLHTQALLSRQP